MRLINQTYLKVKVKDYAIVLMLLSSLFYSIPVTADSSGPQLAAYYDRFLALCGESVFEWENTSTPVKVMTGFKQVGVGKNNSYALTQKGELIAWRDDPTNTTFLIDQVSSFHAGRSGLLVIQENGNLLQFNTKNLLGFGEEVTREPTLISENILTASVGDSANYYVTNNRALFVHGRAHRGQYGDGKLTASENYIQTAQDVIQVVSHTGHALVLKQDGTVWGTGGNIYGPLSKHGYGDKAAKWGQIFSGVNAIATGSTHSLAIKHDRSLWIWGQHEGLDPKQIMTEVSVVAAGSSKTVALSKGYLWQWDIGSQPKKIMKCEHP